MENTSGLKENLTDQPSLSAQCDRSMTAVHQTHTSTELWCESLPELLLKPRINWHLNFNRQREQHSNQRERFPEKRVSMVIRGLQLVKPEKSEPHGCIFSSCLLVLSWGWFWSLCAGQRRCNMSQGSCLQDLQDLSTLQFSCAAYKTYRWTKSRGFTEAPRQ